MSILDYIQDLLTNSLFDVICSINMASIPALVTQLCPTPCDSIDYSPPYFSVHGGLPFPSTGDLPNTGTEPRSPALQPNSLSSDPPEF